MNCITVNYIQLYNLVIYNIRKILNKNNKTRGYNSLKNVVCTRCHNVNVPIYRTVFHGKETRQEKFERQPKIIINFWQFIRGPSDT